MNNNVIERAASVIADMADTDPDPYRHRPRPRGRWSARPRRDVMSWVLTPWGIVVSYLVGAFTVVPLMWWALLTPRRRAERAAEDKARMRDAIDRIECDGIAEATRRYEEARRAHPSQQKPDE